jgi:hypothetical protein
VASPSSRSFLGRTLTLRLPHLHEPKHRPILRHPPRHHHARGLRHHDVKLQGLGGQGEALVQLKDAVGDVRFGVVEVPCKYIGQSTGWLREIDFQDDGRKPYPGPMDRKELAERVADGLAGMMQLHAAQDLHGLHGEDTARFTMIQIIRAQAQWRSLTSQKPTNWKDGAKARVDVALLPWNSKSTWYGLVELKWPQDNVEAKRVDIIQDAVRVASAATGNMNAKFVIVGCTSDFEKKLFELPHPRATDAESQRLAFNTFLSRTPGSPQQTLKHSALVTTFPTFADRAPVNGGFNSGITATLFAVREAHVGNKTVGRVFVWQCNKTRGPTPR